jgi:Fe-S cluster biogenesis protein NfuA
MESQQLIQRIEELVQKVEALPDGEARATGVELLQSLMELNAAAIERMLELTAESGAAGEALIDGFARDQMVSGLLLLYGLHPVALETRVAGALEKVRPYVHSHGGSVDVLGIEDGVVRLRFQGSGKSCPSTATTLKLAIEAAIYEAAPDVTAIEAEEVLAAPAPPALVTLGIVRNADRLKQSNGGSNDGRNGQ